MEAAIAHTAKAFRLIVGAYCDNCPKHANLIEHYCNTAESQGFPSFLEPTVDVDAPSVGGIKVNGYFLDKTSDEFKLVPAHTPWDTEKNYEFMNYVIRDTLWCFYCHHTLYHMCLKYAKTGIVDCSFVTYNPDDILISSDPQIRRNILANACVAFEITKDTKTIPPGMLELGEYNRDVYSKFSRTLYLKFWKEPLFSIVSEQ